MILYAQLDCALVRFSFGSAPFFFFPCFPFFFLFPLEVFPGLIM